MSREVWGTYSVTDHLNERAFLADLMLYDRLVLPVPEEHLDEEAQTAWKNWNAPLQQAFVEVLKRYDRVRTIPWRVGQWDEGKEAFAKTITERPSIDKEVAEQVGKDAFLYTRMKLIEGLPPRVRGVTTVPTIRAKGSVAARLGFRLDAAGQLVPASQGVAAAVLGMKFLVPALDRRVEPDDVELVLKHTSTPEHRRQRSAFWAWQQDFFGDDVIARQDTLNAAVEEMSELLESLNSAAKWGNAKTNATLVFLVGSIAIGFASGPLTPFGMAGVGLSLLQYATDQFIGSREPKRAPEAAIFAIDRTDLPFVGAAN